MDRDDRQTPHQLVLFVNGKKVTEDHPDPEMTLLSFLRIKLMLPGTKLGCGEGGCGACTVMVSRYDRIEKKIINMSVNACLAPLCSMHGLAVTTVEGIGSTKTRLHPVQERIAKSHGSQCGFCTPGIVMSMYTLLRNKPTPSESEMESAFEGNLCRCTGYRPILEGFKTFTKEFQCAMGDQCCKSTEGEKTKEPNGVHARLYDESEFACYDPSQEPIFPSELQLSDEYDRVSLLFRGDRVTWHRPATLSELLDLKSRHPDARLVVGNTEIGRFVGNIAGYVPATSGACPYTGVEVKFKNMYYPVLIAATHVTELRTVRRTDTGVVFGASTTLSELEDSLKDEIHSQPEFTTRVYVAIVEMLRWFAGHQIRNVAAIAGNIITASPISDLNPIFLAAGCNLQVTSKDRGLRTIKMDDKFFLGYRRTALEPDEVMVSIHIPYTSQNEYFAGYKQAQRREDDIAIVNAGLRVQFEDNTNIIQDVAFSFGGMAPVTVMATKAMKTLVGKRWEDSLLEEACRVLAVDLPLAPGTPGGMESYRRTLTTSFFFKFYLTVCLQLQKEKPDLSQNPVPSSYHSATYAFHREPSKGVQVYEEPSPQQPSHDAVGRNLAHRTAAQQATGEAQYCDDIPLRSDELYLALVVSTKAHANLLRVDPTEALAMPGVRDYISYTDIPGNPMTGATLLLDEEIFAKDTVLCQGQAIGAIIADSQPEAQRAAKAVSIQYEELDPIITIEDAIAAESFHGEMAVLSREDVGTALGQADHVLEGEVRIGGQEHFYLETHVSLAIPRGEDGEMEVYCSTQNPTHAQTQVAQALGVSANRINIRVKRIGGGFGGKESRFAPVLLAVTLAARKMNRPVRCMLDRDEDMVITGTRHPYLGRYKVGFSSSGKIVAMDTALYSNAGCSLDLSRAVLERALLLGDNCCNVPNYRVKGYLCKTNIPSNTAFRGFGAPQGMFVMETAISDVALKLNIPREKVVEVNLFREGDETYYGQPLVNCNIGRCWTEVIERSNFSSRRAEVDQFNSEHRWKKRGISVVPTKFGIAFTVTFLNQAGALVHVYTDGSVLLSHGGAEMGQGIHTKMVQVASRVLGIPTDRIHISETNTANVPNTSPTAASSGSDLNGMAVLNACQTIMDRLAPYKENNNGGSWDDWVKAAYSDRVSLSATGFYKTPGLHFDWETGRGCPFSYFTYGAACSEVEVDCLTGDHTVLSTDIVMDIGQSLNPAIDIGQVEGAFVQGYGLMTIEEQRYSPKGFLYTRGPGAYKIPGFGDIPVRFNVSLLKGASNPKAVYSSKAIGEPPLFLAASVFFAIKDAIAAARKEVGLTGPFTLDSPATAARIRMGCEDRFTKQFPAAEPGSYTPWFVNL